MKIPTLKTFFAASISAATLALTSCDVDVKEEGKLPDVDVDVDAKKGKLPEAEVNTPDLEVEKKKIEVPTLDIEPAEDGDDN